MKAIILLITGPFMLMFLIAGLQTIEYNVEAGQPVPVQAYGLLACFAIWAILATACDRKKLDNAREKFEGFICKILK